jgi:hypothetical protein
MLAAAAGSPESGKAQGPRGRENSNQQDRCSGKVKTGDEHSRKRSRSDKRRTDPRNLGSWGSAVQRDRLLPKGTRENGRISEGKEKINHIKW